MLECKLCGTQLIRITDMHLRGAKCRDCPELGRRLTGREYIARFGATSVKIGPRKAALANLLELLGDVNVAEIQAKLRELQDQICELEQQEVQLLALLKLVQPTAAALTPTHSFLPPAVLRAAQ